jgi:hypothetical protein
MTPALTLIALTWIGSIVAGYVLGKLKGHVSAGIILTVILGPLGLVIFACLARTYPVMPASAQRLYESQPEAVRRAGYAYPPQSPHLAPDQDPHPPQSPPGGWQQPPPPGSWQPPPPPPDRQPWQGPEPLREPPEEPGHPLAGLPHPAGIPQQSRRPGPETLRKASGPGRSPTRVPSRCVAA